MAETDTAVDTEGQKELSTGSKVGFFDTRSARETRGVTGEML